MALGDPDRRLIARAAGGGRIEAYAPEALLAAHNRLFLVGGVTLVVVRETPAGRQALLIRRGAGLAALTLRTDADLTLRRFALLDGVSDSGPTFVLGQAAGSEGFTYSVLAPDSREIREEWLAARQSNCRTGPLTAVPRQWLRDYEAACRAGDTGRGGGG